MNRGIASTIVDDVDAVEHPRVDRNTRHAVRDILTLALCGVICGAETWVEIAAFGRAKREWVRTVLDLPNGIPSHDTFGRVFRRLDRKQLHACFVSWVQESFPLVAGQGRAVAGTALRGSHDKAHGGAALHMVSAWAAETQVVLGQLAVDDKSNEITAIPAVLGMLDLAGGTVTIDAMGCQKEIATQSIEQGGEYSLAVQRNHPHLHRDGSATFAARCATDDATVD